MAKVKIVPRPAGAENLRKKDVQVALRISSKLNENVEGFAKRNNLKFSDAIRQLIELGLAAE